LTQVTADLLAARTWINAPGGDVTLRAPAGAPAEDRAEGAVMTVTPPPGSPAESAASAAFASHRDLLFGVVYGILGSAADTEEVLSETWRSWARRPAPDEHGARPRVCLVRAATRQALARLDAIARRREAYVGPWLPEPLVRPLDQGAGRDGPPGPLTVAMLVALDELSALERTVFVLAEVACCPPEQIAEIVGRSPAAVRDLAARAAAEIGTRRPADPRARQPITARFAEALLSGDQGAFVGLLAPEVTFRTDSGGTAGAAHLNGDYPRERAAALLAGGSYWPRADPQVRCRLVNGEVSLVVTAAGAPFAVLVLEPEPDGGRVRRIYAVTNPGKLGRAG
jgi:RNA polymerase sigma-70 factor (ECF subfamily)